VDTKGNERNIKKHAAMIKTILAIILILIPFSIFGQCVNITIETNILYQADSLQNIEVIQITNITDEDILIWLDKHNPYDDKSFTKYFNKKHNDFSLSMLLSEYGSTLVFIDDFKPILYKTFYKVLESQKQFYIIVKNNDIDLIRSQIRCHRIQDSKFYNNLSYSGSLILIE